MMNIPGRLTNKQLLQHLISDKNIHCLFRRSTQNPSIYDVNKLSEESQKEGSKYAGPSVLLLDWLHH
ncbi:hypothetical protein QQG55_56895 [Brugia pahangi]